MKKSVAYGLVMVVSVFWGMSFIVLTQLLKWLGTMEILALRWTLASVIFACLIGAGRIRINLRGKNMKFLLLTGLTEPCIYSVFEIYGLKYSSASISSIFIATIPCATLLVSILFFHKKPGRTGVLSILLAFAGVVVTTVFSPAFIGGGQTLGYLFMTGAVMAGTVFGFFSSKSGEEYEPMAITAVMSFMGMILFNGICLLEGGRGQMYVTFFTHWQVAAGIAFLGICCSVICYAGFNKLLCTLDISIANNLTSAMITIIGVVAGVTVNGDPAGLYTVIGLTMTVSGVWLSSKSM